jgi:acetoin utilization protein AcuC
MNDLPVSLYLSDALGRYGFGDPHPFGTDRMAAFYRETLKQGLDTRVNIITPARCLESDLERFHSRRYINQVKHQSINGEGLLDLGDTPAFQGVFEATGTVVGAGLDGLSRMFSGDSPRIFVPIAGLHHAQRDSAAGFCVFNDAGVLIETLQQQYGIKRIAYIDIDAHHGDGVFYAFEDNPNVIFADIHEDGKYLYPGTGGIDETGKGAAKGCKLNIPLPPGADDKAFYAAWNEVEQFIDNAKPQIIILQAGADSIKGDPITHLAFTPLAHEHAARGLASLADRHCEGRIIGLGGGGYNRNNLALGWNSVLRAFIET